MSSMVNMAVLCPHTFSLVSHNYQVLPLVTRGLLPHVLKFIHKIYLHRAQLCGVLKNSEGGGGIIQISQKEKLFQSHKKHLLFGVISPCITFPYPFQNRPSSVIFSVFQLFFNVGVRLYIISPQFTQGLKTGILNVAVGWALQFSPINEKDKKKIKDWNFLDQALSLVRYSLVD